MRALDLGRVSNHKVCFSVEKQLERFKGLLILQKTLDSLVAGGIGLPWYMGCYLIQA
jgi:hypothetical protein